MLASHRGPRVKRRNFIAVFAGGVAYPLLAGAQRKGMQVIGFIGSSSPGQTQSFLRRSWPRFGKD